MESPILTALRRHAKAVDPKSPFPPDRIFPSTDEMMRFFDALLDALAGFEATADQLQTLQAQMRSINI